jgi:hypothetical protein
MAGRLPDKSRHFSVVRFAFCPVLGRLSLGRLLAFWNCRPFDEIVFDPYYPLIRELF